MRWGSLIIVACLLAASCSDNTTSDEPNPDPPATGVTESTLSPSSTTTLRPPPPTDPPPLDVPTIGDLEIPCRPADSASIVERPGVTGDAITIGTGTDRGGIATTGAGRGALDMVETLAGLCNSLGGILGRDIRVEEYDAAGVEAADRVAAACEEVAALVGDVFVEEIEAAFTAASCGLEHYPAKAGLVPTTPFSLHGHLAALFSDPAGAAAIALIGPDTLSATTARATRQAAIEQSGSVMSVVADLSYRTDGRPSWSAIVTSARRAGAGQVHIAGGCADAVVPFVAAATDAGWTPIVVATATAYDEVCLAAADTKRILLELPFLPFEDGAVAPATQAHGELLDAFAAPRTGESIMAASAFWRWALTAEQCLADAAPGCVEVAAASQDGWTGGGLHPELALDGTSPGCAVVVGIEVGAFVRRLPAEAGTYDCNPEWSIAVP